MSRVAAVPNYLRDIDGFSKGCPPGHLFNMYFPIWNESWAVDKKDGNRTALTAALDTNSVSKVIEALRNRQRALVGEGPSSLSCAAVSVSPFSTGLGLEHPTKNGFSFLNPYGIPYLAGSGVKGVLRQSANELCMEGDMPYASEWTAEKLYSRTKNSEHGKLSIADILFGQMSDNSDEEAFRGVLQFHDVVPLPYKNKLTIEVMTPHQPEYYQGKTTPHDSGQPVPVFFLAIPAGSSFIFNITCDLERLRLVAPDLAHNSAWKPIVQSCIDHAFEWLGFGAKTAVGYGAMKEDENAKNQRTRLLEQEQERAASLLREKQLNDLSPEDRAWALNEPQVLAFMSQFEAAKQNDITYVPGRLFDEQRNKFTEIALQWADSKSRFAAAAALEATLKKAWGMPSNKERKAKLQDAVLKLKDG
jgi:CRISPR-associated protein Cmr6